ncbi:MAG: hypothetical protein AB7P17_03230 [Nitrospirales bacterium]|nr:hypothetical protein [Nitrospirales bacterium]
MKKTLFIINNQGQVSEELPSFCSKLMDQEQAHFLLLHQENPAEWSFIPNLMVLENPSKNIFPTKVKYFEQITYQGVLEKIFQVDTALII